VKLARLRRQKLRVLLHIGYRPKTNAIISLDMGHILTGEHGNGRNRERKGNLKLECGLRIQDGDWDTVADWVSSKNQGLC
jgi:hypothetical protein